MPLQRLDFTPTPNRLAEALGEGLDILATGKLNQLHRQAGQRRLEDFGLSPQDSAYANSLPPKEQFALVQQLAQARQSPQQLLASSPYQGYQEQNAQQTPSYSTYQPQNAPTNQQAMNQTGPMFEPPSYKNFQDSALKNLLGGLEQFPRGQVTESPLLNQRERREVVPPPSPRVNDLPQGQVVPPQGFPQAGPQGGEEQNQIRQQERRNEPRAPLAKPIPQNIPPQLQARFAEQRLREQAQANATNKVFNTEFEKEIRFTDQIDSVVKEMGELLATGKVATTVKGKLVPASLQNAETNAYIAKSNELAILTASKAGGRLTQFGLRAAQLTKPNIEQPYQTQKKLQESIQKNVARLGKVRDIYDQILNDNDGYEPPHIATIIRNRLKDREEVEQKQALENPIQHQYPTSANQGQPQVPQQPSLEENFAQPQQEQPEESNESIAGTLGRNAVRLGARALESGATQVGDLLSAGLGLANYATTPLSEEQLTTSTEPEAEKAKGILRNLNSGARLPQVPTYEQIQKHLPASFPTSEQAEKFTENLTGGYTKPRGMVEQALDNVVSTVSKLAGPGLVADKIVKGLSSFLSPAKAIAASKLVVPFSGVPWKQALKIGLASEGGAAATEFLGGGHEAQNIARVALGTLAASHGTKGLISEGISNNYKAATQEGTEIFTNLKPIEEELMQYYRDIPSVAPYKEEAQAITRDTINSLYEKSKRAHPGKISAADLVKTKQAVNELYTLSKEPKQPGGKHLPPHARKYPGKVSNILNKHIAPLAEKNPNFGKPYALAEDMFKAQKAGETVKKFFEDLKPSKGSILNLHSSIIGYGGVHTIGSLAEIFSQLKDHPVARRLYMKAFLNAARGNTGAAQKSFNELNRVMKKEERR